MKKIILLILMFFLVGCQSSSTENSVSKKHTLNPKVEISNVIVSNNQIKGNLRINESDDFYSKVYFKNIKLTSSKCYISNVYTDKEVLQNNELMHFELQYNCIKEPSNIEISFDEIAEYVDTSIKKAINTFSKTVAISSKFSVEPLSVVLKPGESYTFNVYTFDENNSPRSEEIKINPPMYDGRMIGEFDKYSITTDENGKGAFTYIAPKTINKDITLQVPIKFNNQITKTKNITITTKTNN